MSLTKEQIAAHLEAIDKPEHPDHAAACAWAKDVLHTIDIKAQAGLCQFRLEGARAFLQDVRELTGLASA